MQPFRLPAVLPALATASETEASPRLLVVLFDGFELLDVFGPVELLLLAGFNVTYAAEPAGVVRGGVARAPTCTSLEAPLSLSEVAGVSWDLLLLPGGQGTRALVSEAPWLAALRSACNAAHSVCSVCTGSALLAAAGMLAGCKATSNKRAFEWVVSSSALASEVEWQPKARWVADRSGGKLMASSSGVAAGMDMAVWLASELLGARVGEAAARRAEYVPSTDAGRDPFG
jgi:putative intracellular protease/amidase